MWRRNGRVQAMFGQARKGIQVRPTKLVAVESTNPVQDYEPVLETVTLVVEQELKQSSH